MFISLSRESHLKAGMVGSYIRNPSSCSATLSRWLPPRGAVRLPKPSHRARIPHAAFQADEGRAPLYEDADIKANGSWKSYLID